MNIKEILLYKHTADKQLKLPEKGILVIDYKNGKLFFISKKDYSTNFLDKHLDIDDTDELLQDIKLLSKGEAIEKDVYLNYMFIGV